MIREAVIRLLNDLERIGRVKDELYDTDVKEHCAEQFIEVFFKGAASASIPAYFGMLSAEGNTAVQSTFKDFAENLSKYDELPVLTEKERWKIFDEVVTVGGQHAEAFFGALCPDNLLGAEAAEVKKAHWLQRPFVYVLFIAVPWPLFVITVALAFPNIATSSLKLLVTIGVAAFASLLAGDASWQFLSNRTYRKHGA